MLVNLYDATSSRRLAASVVAAARSPLRTAGPSSVAQVVEVGGGWHLSTWRDALRRLAIRGTVTVVGLRALPGEPHRTDADWKRIAHHVAGRAGIAGQPWAAVRTNPTTVAVLTATPARPLHLDAVRAYARTTATRPPRVSAADHRDDGRTVTTPQPTSAVRAATARGVAALNFAAPPATTPTDPPPPVQPTPTATTVHRHHR